MRFEIRELTPTEALEMSALYELKITENNGFFVARVRMQEHVASNSSHYNHVRRCYNYNQRRRLDNK